MYVVGNAQGDGLYWNKVSSMRTATNPQHLSSKVPVQKFDDFCPISIQINLQSFPFFLIFHPIGIHIKIVFLMGIFANCFLRVKEWGFQRKIIPS
jgi:hypothetical protein